MVEIARKVCGSVRVQGKTNEVKAAIKIKKASLQEVLGARDEDAKERST